MAKWAWRLFLTPRRHGTPQRERQVLQRAERFFVSTPAGEVQAYSWGADDLLFPWDVRPTILLVHGWEGRATQLGSFVGPLVDAGYRVVGFDAPAHGRSPGHRTHVVEVAAAIRTVVRHVGGVRALVAHSMGGAASIIAMSEGLVVEKAVLVASSARLEKVLTRFAQTLQMPGAVERELWDLVTARFGRDAAIRYSPCAQAGNLRAAALILHDVDDAEVEYAEGQLLADSWPGATLVSTAGLGHRRILRDEYVVETAVRFIRGQ
jgi:pimeloyl-ACP methyl ester carboxylesterase